MLGVSLPRAIIYAVLILLSTFVISYRYPSSARYKQRLAETMATPLKFLTVSPKGNHTATVIFLHVGRHSLHPPPLLALNYSQGLGDSGYGWKPVADQLSRDPSFQHIKWILPHA